MRIIERLDIYMRFKHLNDNQLSVMAGLSNGVLNKSRKEGRDLSLKAIEKIAIKFNDLNKNWLVTGQGEMLKSSAGDQVNGTVHGIAINRGSAEVRVSDALWTKEQIDELLSQNKQLLRIIENLTQK